MKGIINHQGLINRLYSEPSIETVYFDQHGGWLFSPNTFHTNEKSAKDILEEYEKSTEPEPDENAPVEPNPREITIPKKVENKKKKVNVTS